MSKRKAKAELVAPEAEHDADESTNHEIFRDAKTVRIVQLLLTGKDYSEVAAELNIHPTTLWALRRKLRIDEWIARLNTDTIDATRSAYLTAHKLAFQRLVEMLSSRSKVQQKWAIEKLLAMRVVQPLPPPTANVAPEARQVGAAALPRESRAELVAAARAELATGTEGA